MNYWGKISNLGVNKLDSNESKKSKRLANHLLILILVNNFLQIPIIIIFQIYELLIFVLIMITLVLSTIPLIKKGKYELASIITITSAIILIVLSSTIGIRAYSYLYFVPLSIVGLVIFNKKKHYIYLFVMLLTGFFLGAYLEEYYYDENLSNPIADKILFILNNVIILFICVYTVFQYKYSNSEYEFDLAEQNKQIEKQHYELQNIHNSIKDSIRYAQRIQNAILPPAKLVKTYLKNSFIIYKPKEVVSGDFYWTEVLHDKIYFAVADCTSHGVAGAMTSVICHNALNRALKEFHLKSPNEILDKTNELIKNSFQLGNNNKLDGMDIGLICFPKEFKDKTEIEFSGGNIPFIYVKNNIMFTIKPNRQQIGHSITEFPFINHKILLDKGDMLYMYTDGFISQFGGPKNKKIKSDGFKKLLLTISKDNLRVQRKKLKSFLLYWQKNNEQVDDICIVGVKV